jgi:hypothetical protein
MKRTSILQRSGEAIANPAEYRQPKTEQLDGRYPYEPEPEPEEPEVSRAYGIKGVQKLLHIIGDAGLSKKTRVLALTQMRDIVSSQEVQAQVIAEQGVQILSRGIKKDWQEEPVCQAIAGEILAELALNREGRVAFQMASTVPILVRALEPGQEVDVRLGASLALRALSEFRDGLDVVEVVSKRLTPALVAALRDTKTAVLENLTAFFANVTGQKGMLGPLLQSKVTEELVELLGQGKSPHRRQILVHTLRAIENLAFSEAGNAVAIDLSAAKHIAEATASTLGFFWEDVARGGAGALLALAGSEDGKKQIHAYAVPLLAKLVRFEMPQSGMAEGSGGGGSSGGGGGGARSAQNNAASAIRLAAEYPPALEQVLHELVPFTESVVFVFGAGVPAAQPSTRLKALRVLSRWLLNPDDGMRLRVVRTVTALLLQEPAEAAEDCMACLHLVRDLAANSDDFGSDVGRIAHTALLTLCEHSSVAVKQLKRCIADGTEVSDEVYNIVA